jgi:peptidyl-prolyl cis-trans isomerase D
MAVLEKIRVKMGVFITAIIGLALISFIVDADTLQSALSVFSSKYDVGEMNGKSISYQDFQKRVDYFNRINQIVSGSASIDEQTSDMILRSAWQDLLSDNVIIPFIESAGVAVGDEEMFDLSQGKNISQVLAREQAFIGENGTFDRNLLVQFIKAIPMDESGNLATYWDYLEKNMMVDQLVSKYITLLAKSNIQNPVELRRSIEDNNVTSDVSFIVQPYSFAEDTTIVVSKQEVKDYYNKHKHNFDQPASRDLEYVVFEVAPSMEDINAAEGDIEKLMNEFSTTDNLRLFLARNSDKPLDTYYYKAGELASKSPVLDSFAFKAKYSDVLPVFQEGNTFKAARINSIKQLPDSVFVQHILLPNQDKALAKKGADSLIAILEKGADFTQVAAENSLDKNPNAIPGEIGWLTQSAMIPGFDTCFVATPGKLFTHETQYGLHIIKVKERTKPINKVQLAVLEKSAVAGRETYQGFYSKANELASRSEGKIAKFNEVAKEMNVFPMPAYNIAQGAKSIANYPNTREITRWAYDAKVGDVSQIISVDNKYFFVVALTKVREKGIPALESIEKEIASVIRKDKANEKLVASVKEKTAGLTSLDAIAEALGTTVSKQTGVSFGAPGSQQFDPKFIGFVAGATPNTLVGPVAGNIGAYIFTVDSRETGAFFTEDDAKARTNQVFGYQVQMIPTILEKAAKVVDNRAKYF